MYPDYFYRIKYKNKKFYFCKVRDCVIGAAVILDNVDHLEFIINGHLITPRSYAY